MVISLFKFVREERKKITIDFEAMNQMWCSKEVERCWKALIATKTEQTDHVIHWGDGTWNWQLQYNYFNYYFLNLENKDLASSALPQWKNTEVGLLNM